MGARKARNSHSDNGSQVNDRGGDTEGGIGEINAQVTGSFGQGVRGEAEHEESKEVGGA